MEVLESKYSNFKAFCKQMQPENEFVKLLQATPLDLFLQTIKAKSDENKTTEDICAMIFEKANIDKTKLNEADLNKFTRYVTYFNEVIKTLA